MHILKFSQKIPLPLEACWEFFAHPSNLKKITPEFLGFEIVGEAQGGKMFAGQIIHHTLRPFWNIPIEWITEITHVQEPLYFIDEQRFGPYRFWHHEHWFKPLVNGVEILDHIYYKMPLGFLGEAVHKLKVKKDIEAIFAFRKAKLEEMFGPYPSESFH